MNTLGKWTLIAAVGLTSASAFDANDKNADFKRVVDTQGLRQVTGAPLEVTQQQLDQGELPIGSKEAILLSKKHAKAVLARVSELSSGGYTYRYKEMREIEISDFYGAKVWMANVVYEVLDPESGEVVWNDDMITVVLMNGTTLPPFAISG